MEEFITRYPDAPQAKTPKAEEPRYCFACDDMVTAPCEREDCLEAANRRVRAELGLDDAA